VTVFATYLINRQTIKETAKMNNETQKLMMKQLEIQEQQARSTLRDYVYQQRVEFYLYLLENTEKTLLYFLNLIGNYEKNGTYDKQKINEMEEHLKVFCDTLDKKYPIASKRLQGILYLYLDLCDTARINLLSYLDYELIDQLDDYVVLIKDIIYVELNLHRVDQDIDDLMDFSNKKKLQELMDKKERIKEKWEQKY
jgi:hypothetical protein